MDISIRKNKEKLYMNDKFCNDNMGYDDLIKENEALKMELHKLAEKFNKLAEENKELIEQTADKIDESDLNGLIRKCLRDDIRRNYYEFT